MDTFACSCNINLMLHDASHSFLIVDTSSHANYFKPFCHIQLIYLFNPRSRILSFSYNYYLYECHFPWSLTSLRACNIVILHWQVFSPFLFFLFWEGVWIPIFMDFSNGKCIWISEICGNVLTKCCLLVFVSNAYSFS
jgi:hypothetical protein